MEFYSNQLTVKNIEYKFILHELIDEYQLDENKELIQDVNDTLNQIKDRETILIIQECVEVINKFSALIEEIKMNCEDEGEK